MNNLKFTFILLLAFLVSALGDEWMPVQETRSEKDSVLAGADDIGTAKRMSIVKPGYRQRKVALQSEERLPNKLAGLGSQRTFRDQIVAPENPAANIHVGLAVGGTNWLEVKTGKWSNGYSSWEECVADTPGGYQIVLDKFRTNRFEPDRMVTVILRYSYFNYEEVDPNLYPMALLIYMTNVCRFDQLSIERILRPLTVDCKSHTEQVILRIPPLSEMRVSVELDPAKPEQVATLEWTAPRGVTLMSNWPESRDWTTESYLYIKRWMGTGDHKSSIWLKAKDGQEATYTRLGEMVSPPVLELSTNGQLTVKATRESDVEVYTSTNIADWTRVQTLQNVEPTTTLSVPFTEEILLFRGRSRLDIPREGG